MHSVISCRRIATGFASLMLIASFSVVDRAALAAPGVSQPATRLAGRTLPPTDHQLIDHKTGRYQCVKRMFCRNLKRTPETDLVGKLYCTQWCTAYFCRPRYMRGGQIQYGAERKFHQSCGLRGRFSP